MCTRNESANDVRIKEGLAEIVSGGNVFYNPVQEFNRDLSIAVLNIYFRVLKKERQQKDAKKIQINSEIKFTSNDNYKAGEKCEDGLRILEALAATGLRSIRYAKEVVGVREIIANDLSKEAVLSIIENCKHNGVEHLIKPSHANAISLMHSSNSEEKRFDVIDLDPYGCPNRFLDAAVQSIGEGGLILVTATDMAVLAGNAPEACFVKYGSVPLRMKSCHEMALRILLHCMEVHANRYGKYIEPLLSISADFYIRIFIRIYTSPSKCKFSMSKQSMVYQCTGCDSFTLQNLGYIKPAPTEQNPNKKKFCIPTGPPVNTNCEFCDHKHHMGGPIWSYPLHNKEFVNELLIEIQNQPLCNLGTQKRLFGMLSVILEELPDVPLYYTLDKLCCVLKLEIIPMLKFRSALLHEGYEVSFSHALKNSIKTNAPTSVLWDILRCWNNQHPVKQERLTNNPVIKAILNKPNIKNYKFDIHPDANPSSRKYSLIRFQANPTPHWGPGTKSTMMTAKGENSKSLRNQNKKQKSKLDKNENTPQLPDTCIDEVKCKHPKLD